MKRKVKDLEPRHGMTSLDEYLEIESLALAWLKRCEELRVRVKSGT